MKQASVVLLIVVFVAFTCASPSYYWRQGFQNINCAGDMIYTEVYPVACASDPNGVYHYAQCSGTQVIEFHCDDQNCTSCSSNDTYTFTDCSNVLGNPSFSSYSYTCAPSEPITNYTTAEVVKYYQGLGCAGTPAYEVFYSLAQPCQYDEFNEYYYKTICNDNSTITTVLCGNDTACGNCNSPSLTEICTEDLDYNASTTCFKPSTSTTTTTTTATVATTITTAVVSTTTTTATSTSSSPSSSTSTTGSAGSSSANSLFKQVTAFTSLFAAVMLCL